MKNLTKFGLGLGVLAGFASPSFSAAPSNLNTNTVCPLAPHPDGGRSNYRGSDIEYKSANEIGYHKADWFAKDNSYISWEGLDSALLGYPGYEGKSRNFTVPDEVNLRIVAVDVRNVGGELKYHYFTNETANSPMENWSSTKSLVMLQGAHTIRQESGGRVGYDSLVGRASIGSKVTHVSRTSHNETANWFKSITGSQGSQNFVRNWIGTNATFGGLHSRAIEPIGKTIKDRRTGQSITINRISRWNSIGTPNTLSPIVMAEFWKRLAVNETDAVTWLKNKDYSGAVLSSSGRKSTFFNPNTPFGIKTEDLKVLLYGANNQSNYGGLLLGATKNDRLVDAVGGKARLDRLTNGKWRFYGKTGSGGPGSTNRNRHEAAFGGYVCLPAGNSAAPQGRLIAWFMNVQTKTVNKYTVRNTAVRNLFKTLAPEIRGDNSVWKQPKVKDPLAGRGALIGNPSSGGNNNAGTLRQNAICKLRSNDGEVNVRKFPIQGNKLVGSGDIEFVADSGNSVFVRGFLKKASDSNSTWASIDSPDGKGGADGEWRQDFGAIFVHSTMIDWNSCR